MKQVGEERARAASTDAKRALELASFALWVAERVTGEESWASRVFSWAFLGNARRVGNDLVGAEEAFARSARLQEEPPKEGVPSCPSPGAFSISKHLSGSVCGICRKPCVCWIRLPRWRPQRTRFRHGSSCASGQIALDRLGDSEGSISALREALTEIDHEADPSLLCMLRFNLMDTLCSVGRASEAAEMLPTLRRLQAQLGNGLNQIRLRWLEGKIDADGACLSAKGVHAEARKAFLLFRRAVELETDTVELVRRLAAYLRQAQDDPELGFEGILQKP